MNCVLPEPPRPMWTKMMSGGDCLARDRAVTASPALVTRYPSSSSRRACCVLVVGSSSTNKAAVGLVALEELIVHLPYCSCSDGLLGVRPLQHGRRAFAQPESRLCRQTLDEQGGNGLLPLPLRLLFEGRAGLCGAKDGAA